MRPGGRCPDRGLFDAAAFDAAREPWTCLLDTALSEASEEAEVTPPFVLPAFSLRLLRRQPKIDE